MALLSLDQPTDQRIVIRQQVLVNLCLDARLIQLKGYVRPLLVCFDTHHTSPRCSSDLFRSGSHLLNVAVENELYLAAGFNALHIEILRVDSFLLCRADCLHGVLFKLNNDFVTKGFRLNCRRRIRILLLASQDTTTAALISLVKCPDSFYILVSLVTLHCFVPGQEADAEVHLGQEWVDKISTRSNLSQESLESFLFAHVVLGHANSEQLVLCDKLAHLHCFVQVEPSVVVAQDSVQQLVEVNEAIL